MGGFTVGSLRLAVCSWRFFGRGVVVRFWVAQVVRGGANETYGTHGTYGVAARLGWFLTANSQPQTANRKQPTANPSRFFCVVESAVVNGETAAPMFGVDLNKSAVP